MPRGTTTKEATRLPRKVHKRQVRLNKSLEHPSYDVIIAPVHDPEVKGHNPCSVDGLKRDGFEVHSVYELDQDQRVMIRKKSIREKNAQKLRDAMPPPPRGSMKTISNLRAGALIEERTAMGVDSLPSESQLDADAERAERLRQNPEYGDVLDRMTDGEDGSAVDLEELAG